MQAGTHTNPGREWQDETIPRERQLRWVPASPTIDSCSGSLTSGICTSRMKRPARFSLTMPSEAAKKARTWLIKCFSSALRLSQCRMSSPRSTSSAAVQAAQARGETK
eukprot:1154013-Pelagomonas_calceolata.AAC.2